MESSQLQAQPRNLLAIGLVLVALVGIGSWKASEYVGDNRRVRDENTALQAKIAEQAKEIEKLHDRLQQVYPGWRPGNPIGNPIGNAPGNPQGSASPVGATSK